MIRGILFDCDGELVNSQAANTAFYQNLMVKAGYSKPSEKDVLSCFHMSLLDTIAELACTQDAREVQKIAIMVHDDSLRHPELFEFPPSIHETLSTLRKKYLMGIVTSRIALGLSEVLSAGQLYEYFDITITYEDYANPKPHPEPLHRALTALHLMPTEAVYIGDSPTDILAAEAAGMSSILLASEPNYGATITIPDFSQVDAAIATIENISLATRY